MGFNGSGEGLDRRSHYAVNASCEGVDPVDFGVVLKDGLHRATGRPEHAKDVNWVFEVLEGVRSHVLFVEDFVVEVGRDVVLLELGF